MSARALLLLSMAKRSGLAARDGGGTSSGQHETYHTRVGLKIRGPANLAGAWSAQPVPASPRPPRAAHRPAAMSASGHHPAAYPPSYLESVPLEDATAPRRRGSRRIARESAAPYLQP